MRIALDAMGGDHAPEQTVKGAFDFLCQSPDEDVTVILVGCEDTVKAETVKYPFDMTRIDIIHAPEVVSMNDRPARIVKTKRDSSLVRTVELVKSGEADGAVSAGSTGALLSASLLLLDRIPGVRRPAVCPLIPSDHGGFLLCDAGANVDVRASDLVQFALMARANSIHIFDHSRPHIGLLNIGTEAGKGNELTLKAHDLFLTHVDNFVGNVEACDLFAGVADVVICDGFVGNILMKFAEGLGMTLARWLPGLLGEHLSPQAMRQAREGLAALTNIAEVGGGGPLFGIDGVVIVGHGRARAASVAAAINLARKMVDLGMVEAMRQELAALRQPVKE